MKKTIVCLMLLLVSFSLCSCNKTVKFGRRISSFSLITRDGMNLQYDSSSDEQEVIHAVLASFVNARNYCFEYNYKARDMKLKSSGYIYGNNDATARFSKIKYHGIPIKNEQYYYNYVTSPFERTELSFYEASFLNIPFAGGGLENGKRYAFDRIPLQEFNSDYDFNTEFERLLHEGSSLGANLPKKAFNSALSIYYPQLYQGVLVGEIEYDFEAYEKCLVLKMSICSNPNNGILYQEMHYNFETSEIDYVYVDMNFPGYGYCYTATFTNAKNKTNKVEKKIESLMKSIKRKWEFQEKVL